MNNLDFVTYALATAIVLSSYKGFKSESYTDRYIFHTDPILKRREYDRLITSGFLHGGWVHLLFNTGALLAFSAVILQMFGLVNYLVIYFGSLVGGSLLSLYIHRNHGDYRALGASGAISGLIFAYILLFPNNTISLFILPIEIKGWIFGLAYVLISIYGIKSNKDNIGHDAHLGGGIVGLVIAAVLMPELALKHWWVALIVLVPSIFFIVLIVRNPTVLLVENYWGEVLKKDAAQTRTNSYTYKSRKEEIDEILDKIRKYGIDSLSDKEKKKLDDLSKR